MDFLTKLDQYAAEGIIPEKLYRILQGFHKSYLLALPPSSRENASTTSLFDAFIDLIKTQCLSPFSFEPYHQRIEKPFDYYTFGLDFIHPLIDMKQSRILHPHNLNQIITQLDNGDNVILLANHQTEADPQIISILLSEKYPRLATDMIFVAGERVTTDPLAIPFSMGRNLLCIYSKNYIDTPPELKHQKQVHNKRTMQKMRELLSEGKKCIYVAPSGGRDRMNADGIVEVAPFDPQSIEMFDLMSMKSKTPTHFYPMALATYDLLPPPKTTEHELGEVRLMQRAGCSISFGEEVNFRDFSPKTFEKKRELREIKARHVWNLVKSDYEALVP